MTITVSMLAGYGEGPLFFDMDDTMRCNHTVAEAASYLGLSKATATDLEDWDQEYQRTLDHTYPPDSRFPSPEAKRAWIERGKELAARIKQDSSIVASVDYQANGCYENGTCVF
ncbi:MULTISPECIES: hypothetical protein [Actinoalloteichus]|uniref:Uncharacterized protein n=1 Tax=Actinoalloteichus fjordicus TaxID=1612552 RepID=A0AAC9LHQ1_9PSEU|nr:MULTISPECIES: hypothetical protein [Actinoalloteichus]APU16529.1 hypothetical protein UA74_22555 [Actinoalloteichus fjordicus]APU22597.1 hypothetical protein UA75_23075 [Actinoalloteichus sp. GBA129-24]